MSYDNDSPAPTGPQLPTCGIALTSPRADDWRRVFKRLDNIPITSYQTQPAGLASDCYMLDLTRISLGEKMRLIDMLAAHYGLTSEQVAYEMRDDGCPISSDDVVVPLPLFAEV